MRQEPASERPAPRCACEEPNPYCENRSDAGDACGACQGCLDEVQRLFHSG